MNVMFGDPPTTTRFEQRLAEYMFEAGTACIDAEEFTTYADEQGWDQPWRSATAMLNQLERTGRAVPVLQGEHEGHVVPVRLDTGHLIHPRDEFWTWTTHDTLDGLRVVLSGHFGGNSWRNEGITKPALSAMLQARGATVSSTWSADTDLLLLGSQLTSPKKANRMFNRKRELFHDDDPQFRTVVTLTEAQFRTQFDDAFAFRNSGSGSDSDVGRS